MATSVIMNTSDNNGYHTSTENHDQGYSQPIRRSSGGRRKVKNGTTEQQKKKNKEPQRGMGVEKLERMRTEEILKNPVLNNNSSFISDPNLFNAFQYSKLGEFPNGQMGLINQQLGFHISDQFNNINTGLFGVGPGSSGGTSFGSKSSVSEISKELSSNKYAAFKCQSEYCSPNSCKKKKRFNGGNLGFGARVKQNMNIQMCSAVGDCGFLGLSVGDNQNIFNQENLSPGFKTHLVHQVGYAIRNGQPGVEVLAAHKKGPSSSSNQESENLVMEYEFFPGCKKDSKNDELVMMEQNVVGSISEASLGDEQTCLGIGCTWSWI